MTAGGLFGTGKMTDPNLAPRGKTWDETVYVDDTHESLAVSHHCHLHRLDDAAGCLRCIRRMVSESCSSGWATGFEVLEAAVQVFTTKQLQSALLCWE
jgi:hypothetical protein